MFKFNTEQVLTSVTFDRKTLEQRITKLTEEVGELASAILNSDSKEIFEESIDNLMVLLSIFVDLNGSIGDLDKVCEDAFICSKNSTVNFIKTPTVHFLEYSKSVGLLAESIQKYSATSTSLYKGKIDTPTILKQLNFLIYDLTFFIGTQKFTIEDVNSTIFIKNSKWLKNSLNGFIKSNKINFIRAFTDIEVIKHYLLENLSMNDGIHFINYNKNLDIDDFFDSQISNKISDDKLNYFIIFDGFKELQEELERYNKMDLYDFKYLIIEKK